MSLSKLEIYVIIMLVGLFPMTSILWSSIDNSKLVAQREDTVRPDSPIDRKAQRDLRRQQKSARRDNRNNRRALASYYHSDKPILADASGVSGMSELSTEILSMDDSNFPPFFEGLESRDFGIILFIK